MQNYDIQRSPIVAKLMKIYDEDFFLHQEKIIDTVIDDIDDVDVAYENETKE